ncbi:S-layer homology domain-containing protein [Paenibacillus gallinarum]|uniref:S-layer homology domain-containing protein n=1 Tax=Paenibacillus gallinarum TaxID=2762232 RepID=A0ABR8T3L6_9BACL|nr:S-layer homology domain-containing protein [Paenibacillus gallinarum]MBD7970287.1 S-layer homology domain-containing protein [Paenibacillus gallinarum]
MKKHFTKIAGIALVAALTVSMIGNAAQVATAATTQFTDVKPNHWAYSAINKGVSKGYIEGYQNGTFKPNASVTRAEFVKMVVSAMKLETTPASGKWYVQYVNAASKAGLYASADFSNNEAAWTKVMTRDEMARVASRAIGETTKENDKWMYLATKTGLIEGVGKGQIAPKGLTTRAQAVVLIERILSKNSGGYLEADKYAVGSAEIYWHGTNIFTVMPEMWVTPESDLKQNGKSSVEDMWNENLMTITSKDKLYQGKLDALIAIDLADPNDPNLGLITPINTLKWYNNRPSITNLMVKDQKNSYVLFFKGGTVYNKDTKKYNPNKNLQFRVDGFDSPDLDAFFKKGVLNTSARVYRNSLTDTPAVIIPKTGTIQQGDLVIRLQAPAGGSLFSENILLRLVGIQ